MNACPFPPELIARLHPDLRETMIWAVKDDTGHYTAECLDEMLTVCNRKVLPQIAQLLIEHVAPTPTEGAA